MRSLLLLFGLFVVALSGQAGIFEQRAAAIRALGITAEHLQTLQSKGGFELQDAFSTCNDTIFAAKAQAEMCPVFQIFDPMYMGSPAEMTTLINTHCDPTTGCALDLHAALQNVLTDCTLIFAAGGAAQDLWNIVGIYMLINVVPCIKEDTVNQDDELCFVSFKRLQYRLSPAPQAPLTEAELQEFCTECLRDVVLWWLTFDKRGDALYGAALLDTLCLRIENTWCDLKFQELVAFSQMNPGQAFTDAVMANPGPHCHTCVLVALNRYKNLAFASLVWGLGGTDHTTSAEFVQILLVQQTMTFMCTKKGGSFCVAGQTAALENLFADFVLQCASWSPSDVLCNSTQAATCGALYNQVLQASGCCFSDLLNFLNTVCPLIPDPKPQSCTLRVVQLFSDNMNCGIELPERCGEKKALYLKVLIANLKWAWCLANPQPCEDLVMATIALYASLDQNQVDNALVLPPEEPTEKDLGASTRRLLEAATDGAVFEVYIPSSIGSFGVKWPEGPVVDVHIDGVSNVEQPVELITLKSKSAGFSIVPSFMLLILLVVALLL
jgi:hypothetical protein